MLVFSKFILLTVSVVLYVSIGITDAGLIDNAVTPVIKPALSPGSNTFALERIQLTDKLRQDAVEKALTILNQSANVSISAGADANAVNIVKEGFKSAFDLLASCRQSLNAAFIKAHKLMVDKKPAAAVETITKTVEIIKDNIFPVAYPVQVVNGIGLAIAGELARPGFRASIELLQHCGALLFKSLDNANQLAVLGITTEKSDLALLAAHEVFNAGEEAIYKLLDEAAISAFEGLKAAAVGGKVPVQSFTENLLDTGVTDETPEAQIVINELTAAFKEALNSITEKPAIEALNIIYHSFLSSILENSHTIVKAYRAIDAVEKLLGSDPEVAVAALHKELLAVDNSILAVSADALLGIGAAGHIGGKNLLKTLAPALIKVSRGRVNLYNDMNLAEKVAIAGLRGGDLAAKQGLKAARACISAASNALYTRIADAAQIVLRELKAY